MNDINVEVFVSAKQEKGRSEPLTFHQIRGIQRQLSIPDTARVYMTETVGGWKVVIYWKG